jgi:hypothetical protein
MPSYSPERARTVAQLASLSYHHPGDPRIPGLRAELATLKLAEYITKHLSAAPPLNPEQRHRLTKVIYADLGRG